MEEPIAANHAAGLSQDPKAQLGLERLELGIPSPTRTEVSRAAGTLVSQQTFGDCVRMISREHGDSPSLVMTTTSSPRGELGSSWSCTSTLSEELCSEHSRLCIVLGIIEIRRGSALSRHRHR